MPVGPLETESQFLKGIGPKLYPLASKIGLKTVQDVLFNFPRRYEDRRHLPKLKDVRGGEVVTIRGVIKDIETRPLRGGKVILRAVISDGTGMVALTWFNQPWVKKQLEGHEGEVLAFGELKEGKNWRLEMSSPEFELIGEGDDAEAFARITPVYRLTEGLPQKSLRRAAGDAIAKYLHEIVDPFPAKFLKEHQLIDLRTAVRAIHQPETQKEADEARKRLVFEEFFYLQVVLAQRRQSVHQEHGIAFPIQELIEGKPVILPTAPAETRTRAAVVKKERVPTTLFAETLEADLNRQGLREQIAALFPFKLTDAQQRVVDEIYRDMAEPYPMNRLVQGDVGAGKTAVAACAMLAAVRSGYQCALMAPTEILAEQHAVGLRRVFEPLGISVDFVAGKLKARQRKSTAERAKSGETQIVVGTHALIQDRLDFDRLGFVVIDEQHRFGVLQRAALRDKGLGHPDVLVMTATPIPRTLTMTLYGDLDVSIIDQLPPGRKPIKTHWKRASERDSVYQAVQRLLDEGRQAYFVCPLVSESEKLEAQAAEDLYYRLSHGPFSMRKIGLLHGQMKSDEKESVMEAFRRHELDILVSTTVIEVGVDVPNSTVMVIEDAQRFGLAQLHQLRGRVGRGEHQSYCILIADASTDDGRARLNIMTSTTDGFRIAEADLEIRGPGALAGTMQSGHSGFQLASLVHDAHLLEVARQAAIKLIADDPELTKPDHQGIRERTEEKRSRMALITIS
ncbi:MAG: ATP-dependent DNA helicase RecG [Armatimonadetes bacterium]|nr:ATP-dependent DNA helicase RecG [Armatimonadota bacterium]